MTDTKHTPGPWEYQSTHNTERGMEIKIVMPNGSIKSLDEQEANARLMAAAPELLEALEKICRLYEVREHIGENCADGYEAVDYALSVLSKAKGGAT